MKTITAVMLAGVICLLCAQQQPRRGTPQTPAPAAAAAPDAPPPSPAEQRSMLERANQYWKQEQYQEANAEFRALVAADPKNADYRARWGELYLERFQPDIAHDLFSEALEIKPDHARALLGMARIMADEFDVKALEVAEKAIEADPKLYEARELMARVALEDNNEKKAIEQADLALAIEPNALQAMAIHGTIESLDAAKLDMSARNTWFEKILTVRPGYGSGYGTAAHFFVLNRRYEEGIEFYRKAIAIQPNLWRAHSELGINLMRLGADDEARKELELSWANKYQDKPTSNTLKLMDSYKNFEFFRDGNTVVKLDKKEAAVLRPYVEGELKRAISVYEKKYGFKLDRPVQVEVYPNHDDFAVRTMGMPGLGILGVTFGYIVAMDSPSGRPPGSFHWDSTMWHELSHVFVLGMTKHRVPRWFTEGLAVHEETAASQSPDWGDRLDPHVIQAIRDKKLLGIADLDRGFIHPTYPQQVVVSYFQAGKICDYIAKKWGEPKLVELIHAFSANTPTPEVVQQHLGVSAADFDKEFLADLEKETKKTVEGFDKWRQTMKEAEELAKSGSADDVIGKVRPMRDVYPDYVEHGSAYELLAKLYLQKGDKRAAIEQLELYSKVGGRDPETLKKLAALDEEAGRKSEAKAALTRLLYIDPIDQDLLSRLGSLELEAGESAKAVREFRALLAMKPIDPAAAHFHLAEALHLAGDDDQARDEVLASLETAPGYRPAQKMLLELSGKTKK